MIKTAAVIACFIILVTMNALPAAEETWESFTGVSCPAEAQIEVVEQSRDSIVVEMILDGMQVQEREHDGKKFHFLSIPNADWTHETGKPRLPVVRTFLAIPSDDDLEIEVEDEQHRLLTNYNVYPVGKEVVRRSSSEVQYIDEEFALDEEFYSIGTFYPRKLADISFSGYLREQRLVQLEFRPIAFNPGSGELTCYSFLRVRLSYDSKAGAMLAPSKSGPLAGVYQANVANYNAMVQAAPPLNADRDGSVIYPDNLLDSQKVDYVIIAPEGFYNSQKLRQLADWRAQYSGLDVAVVSSNRLYYSFGSSATQDEKIRSFIQYVYNSWDSSLMPDGRIGYVLLIGDVELLPAHISSKKSFDEQIATDNWYVCVSGDDLMPDIMLGRLPAKGLSELNVMIDKIIQYEQKPVYGDWANNALLLSGTVESLHEDMEYARDEYLLPAGYNVSQVSALDGGGASQVISAMNKGQHIVDYAGHGWVNGWEIFQKLDIPRLRNDGMLPAIFSLACSTGYFDNPDTDSIAEAFLKTRNGAIAFLGSSRLASISDVGFGLSEAVSMSHIYILGETVIHTKLKLLPNSSNMELYNLMGDPALDLSAPRQQPGMADLIISSMDVSFEPEEPKQGDPVQITVTIRNLGAADAHNVTVELRDEKANGTLIGTNNVPDIPAGGKTEVQTVWDTPPGEAQHEISVEIYTAKRSDEYYRDNNDAQKTLLVSLESEGWPVEVEEKTLSAPMVADIDSDGDMELLVQSVLYKDNKVYIWHHDGRPVTGWPRIARRGKYDSRSQYSNSSAGPAPAIGDLDGDGNPEIVAVFFTNEVFVWRNDGSTLAGWPITINGYASSSPVLADLDLDGKLEVISGLSNGYIDIRRYDGSSFDGWPVSVGKQGHLFPVVVDMDGDGDLEIVAVNSPLPANSGASVSNLYAWHHDGTTLKGWPVQMPGADAVLPPAAGDLDGDGTAEVVSVSVDGDLCRIYMWNHDGSTVPGWPVTVVEEIGSALALGDLDQDGDVEIIASCRDNTIYAWHHNGRQVFGWPINIQDRYWHSSPILGDLDGDKHLEVIFSSYSGVIHAYGYDGTPVRGWPAITEQRSASSPPAIADMDGDGRTEIACASNAGRIHLLSVMGQYNPDIAMEWNMLSHDQRHTGSYSSKSILPLPPVDLKASDLPDDKGGSILLTWQPSPDDGWAAGYVIYRADSPNGRYSLIGRVSRGVTDYTDDTTQTGITYWYVVRTSDSAYLSTSSNLVSAYSINNLAPNPPNPVYAETGSLDCTLDVWWPSGKEPDLAGYKVYTRAYSGGEYSAPPGASPEVYGQPVDIGMRLHHILTGLTNNTLYYISVTAYDTEGNESLHSMEVSARPEDDDTDQPRFSSFFPIEVVEGTPFYIRCKISDASGIYDSPYLIWDNDNELSEDSHRAQMIKLSPGVYTTDSRMPRQALGDKFIYQVYAYDNDMDWERSEDRTLGLSEKQMVSVIQSASLAYNYPNPAPAGQYTDRTIFRYYVDTDADITIKIYDIVGNLVESLDGKTSGAGYNETEWQINDIASGVYIYRIEIQPVSGNKKVITKKLAIVK